MQFIIAFLVALVIPSAIAADPISSVHGDEKKVALVISNASYRSVSTLANPHNDGDAIKDTLEQIGFEVSHVQDGSASGIRKAVEAFEEATRDADIVLVYYAGHGVQFGGQNYIIPTNFDLKASDENHAKLVNINQIIADIDKASPASAKLYILDACRNNPFSDIIGAHVGSPTKRGLARISVEEPTANGKVESDGYYKIVAFSTAANTVAEDGSGRHSPFTQSLLKYLPQPGLEVGAMLRQVAGDVVMETKGDQKPEYMVQTSKSLFLTKSFITECDKLAADTGNFIGVESVSFGDIDAKKAIPACEEAIKLYPGSARLKNSLARAYEKSRQFKKALKYYQAAADQGHRAAINALGVAYLAGCGMPKPDVKKGLTLIHKARELGHPESDATLTTHNVLPYISDRSRTKLYKKLKALKLIKSRKQIEAGLEKLQLDNDLDDNGLTLETIHFLDLDEIVPAGFKCS